MTDEEKVALALETLVRYGQIDGEHRKAWVIDQAVRLLTGCKGWVLTPEYLAIVNMPGRGWDEGVAP